MSIDLTGKPIEKAVTSSASISIALKVLVLMLVLLSMLLTVMFISHQNLLSKYHDDDRITYIKLDPLGNWTVERNAEQKDDFYLSTVDSTISRLLSKCLSNRPATIKNDWAVCAAFLSNEKLEDFFNNRFVTSEGFQEYASKQSTCFNCDYVMFEVKDIDHKNSIPTSFSDVYGQTVYIYESIVYGNFVSNEGDKTSVVVDLKWSFVADDTKRTWGELLIENPLGIYFVDYIEIEDIKS